MRWSSVATTTRVTRLACLARSHTRCTRDLPAICAKGLPGSRAAPYREGITAQIFGEFSGTRVTVSRFDAITWLRRAPGSAIRFRQFASDGGIRNLVLALTLVGGRIGLTTYARAPSHARLDGSGGGGGETKSGSVLDRSFVHFIVRHCAHGVCFRAIAIPGT